MVVIDGNQRLLSIKLFLNDAFELQGLKTYPELNGYSWATLDPRFRDHIENRTIRCITILKNTHPQIKFDVFERLNTGSVKLNAQELRHGLNHGPLMKQIDDLVKFEKWKKLTGIKNDKRMRSAELVLRYFAFRQNYEAYQKPLSDFLDRYSASSKSLSKAEIDKLSTEFKAVVDKVEYALGRLAFRVFDKNQKPLSPFNSALFDAEMMGFVISNNRKVATCNFDPRAMKDHIQKLFEIPAFINSIRQATSDEVAVRNRIKLFVDHLNVF